MTKRPASRANRLALDQWQAPRAFEIERLSAPFIVRALGADAADGACVSAGLFRIKLRLQVGARVLEQRLFEHSAGLRAPMNIAELVDVQIAAARTALEGRGATEQDALAIIVGFTKSTAAE